MSSELRREMQDNKGSDGGGDSGGKHLNAPESRWATPQTGDPVAGQHQALPLLKPKDSINSSHTRRDS